MPRYLKPFLWLLSATALLCIVAIIAISIMNWNWARPWVNRELSNLANRQVQIDGDIRVDWQREERYDGWRGLIPWPSIYAHDVTVANPEWAASGDTMGQAQAVQILIDLPGLTQRTVRLADIAVHEGHVVLERRADGVNNWTFGDNENTDDEAAWQLEIERLMLVDASLRVLDASQELDVMIKADTADTPDEKGFGTQWTADGHYHGVAVSGEGQIGHILALQNGTEPFPVQGVLHVGDTSLKAEGTVSRPRNLAALDVQLELSGPTMADLYPILGLALPQTPPYRTSGRLQGDLDSEQATWTYDDFTGTVGESDLGGSVKYQQREPRPILTADLHSDLLRFEDLGPLIGSPTSGESDDTDEAVGAKTEAETEAEAQAQADAERTQESEGQLTKSLEQPADKALPVANADTSAWNVMDADVTFVAQRIESTADLPLDDVKGHVTLKDSVLRFDPLDFGVAGGTLESTITLDGNNNPIHASLDAQARGLQLGQLFPGVESMDAALGSVHGDANLTGRGNSVSALMEHASGELTAVVSRGTVSRFLLEAAGLNVANMVFVKLFGDEQVVLECLAAEFRIDDGLVNTQTFILETDDAVVTVEGQINLATEAMDLDIYPDNKSVRIFTLRSPLYVAGTFKNPDIGVQAGPVAARAGAAVALGVVATPLAALLPLLNVGTDDETTCAGGRSREDDQSEDGERLEVSVPGAKPEAPIEP